MSENIRGTITVVRAVLRNQHPFKPTRDEILVMRRPIMSRNEGGMWELPGGKLERSETDRLAGVQKEIRARTGFDIRIQDNNLSLIDKYTILDGDERGMSYVSLAGVARIVGGTLTPDREYLWVTPDDENITDRYFTKHAVVAIALFNECRLGL